MNSIASKTLKKVLSYSRLSCQLQKLLFTSTANTADQNATVKSDIINKKSDLSKDLHFKIKLSGPISIANYMKHVLTHPTKGYYTSNDVFGQEGDFITSPEISQMFGEMIAVWIISECQKFYNKPFQLVELGPGRGTLSKDMLRVFKQLRMNDKVSLHLVEVSPTLSEIQGKNLGVTLNTEESRGKFYKKGVTADNVEVFWYKSVLDLPEGFSVFVAQEFFDALPIHKFQKNKDGWFEVLVDIDHSKVNEEKFKFVLAKTQACTTYISRNETRDHFEISPESINIIKYMATAIRQNGGFSLIVDYGHDGDKTDTFRAFRKHKQCDPLDQPGTADLTADVDFALLKRVARESNNLLCYGPVTQREFLVQLGINVRLWNLCKTATAKQRKQLELGYEKIVGTNEMGSCFKVVSMFPNVLKEHLTKFPVHGFESFSSKSN